jgi:hypothetical protein
MNENERYEIFEDIMVYKEKEEMKVWMEKMNLNRQVWEEKKQLELEEWEEIVRIRNEEYKEKIRIKKLSKITRRNTRKYFKEFVEEDLIRNRFHPKNIDKFVAWGFDDDG